jgi:sporulation protein YtfJ
MSTPLESLMNESLKNIKGLVDANTIVGDVITTPDGTTIIPVTRVSFGFGAGGSDFSSKQSSDGKMFGGGSGGGVTMNPVAFLVVTKDSVRIIPVSNAMTTAERIVDVMPELVGKLNDFVINTGLKKSDKNQDKDSDTIELG